MSVSTRMKAAAAMPNDAVDVDINQLYCVEFSVDGKKYLYQFKIWSSPTAPLFVLVKSNSEMLPNLKSGDILRMKYYSTDAQRPFCHLDTQILDIHWNDQGRFKGHYAVNLGLLGKERPPAGVSVQ